MSGMAGFSGHTDSVYSYYGVAGHMLETMTRWERQAQGSLVFSKGTCLLSGDRETVESQQSTCLLSGDRETVESQQVGERRYCAVLNGRFQNVPELQTRLDEAGSRLPKENGEQLLIAAFVQWGTECLRYMRGYFSFALWEESGETLFCARDPLGVKPLYYTLGESMLAFASELKTLLAHPLAAPEIDHEGAAELLLLGPGRTPGCGVFKGVQELKPGHYLLFGPHGLSVTQYYELRAAEHTDSPEETLARVRTLVLDSIHRQLEGGKPLCAFLSGGLDSSVITAVAAQALPAGALKTYSVDYVDNDKFFQSSYYQPGSDKEYICRMNEHLGIPHTTLELGTQELVESLFRAVDARDLPGMADVDGSLLLFCESVRRHEEAALSGECADEIFGGYPWYRDPVQREKDGFPWSQSTDYRAAFLHPEHLEGFEPGRYVHDRYLATLAQTVHLNGESATERRIRQLMRLHLDWFMQTLVVRTDCMSGYAGLEVRVPYCDTDIVEYLYNIPWELKDYKGREKGLLRQAMSGLLPEEVLWRKKSPYPKTHHPEYLARVSALLREILEDTSSPLLMLCRKEALEALLDESGARPWYGQLMTVPQTIGYFIQVNYWMQRFKVRIL